jgi:hypothetical protein
MMKRTKFKMKKQEENTAQKQLRKEMTANACSMNKYLKGKTESMELRALLAYCHPMERSDFKNRLNQIKYGTN